MGTENKTVVAVAGIGYVGMSLAILLAQKNRVVACDIQREKVESFNRHISPVRDDDAERYLSERRLDLTATTDARAAYENADFVVICTPTNYDDVQNRFDTRAVEQVVEAVLACNQRASIVIKSTIPIGYTRTLCRKYGCKHIFFSPEFLREGRALHDNLYPSRIIVGMPDERPETRRRAETFAGLLSEGAEKSGVPVMLMGLEEAEAVKLFANTYLAMRVAYFNELDAYAETHALQAGQIIAGICADPRIGSGYNNPSFGYGGYCLPKDTRQLRASFGDTPQRMTSAVIAANEVRKGYIVDQIIRRAQKCRSAEKTPVIGVYRLIMKAGSDNFRQSAIHDVMKMLREKAFEVIVYESTLAELGDYHGYPIENDLERFKAKADVIIANRNDRALDDVQDKVYTRDIFGSN